MHAVAPERFQLELLAGPALDQRINVLDTSARTAYEFKVSGKNATAEFYADIVQIMLYNEQPRRQEIDWVHA